MRGSPRWANPNMVTARSRSENNDDLVSASELAEFVYCQRAWALAREGHRPSDAAQALRLAGNRFHEDRAIASSPGGLSLKQWAALLMFAGLLLLILALVLR